MHGALRSVMGRRMVRSVWQAAHAVVASHRVRARGAREQRQRRGKQRDDHDDGLRTAHPKKTTTVRLISI